MRKRCLALASEPSGQQGMWDLLGMLHWLVTFWGSVPLAGPCTTQGNCGSPQHLPVHMESPGDEDRRHQLVLWAQALVFLPLTSVSRAAAPQRSLLGSCTERLCRDASVTLLLPSPPLIAPGANDCLILPLCLTLSGGKCVDPELCKGIDRTGILPCERQLLLGPCLAALWFVIPVSPLSFLQASHSSLPCPHNLLFSFCKH